MDDTAKHSILVVDDEPEILEMMVAALEYEGYAPWATTDPEEALDLLEQHTVDVIISDIVMPRLTGLELLRAARARDPHVQVLLITAYGAPQVAQAAVTQGAFGLLQKPFELDALLAGVGEGLARARASRRLRQAA